MHAALVHSFDQPPRYDTVPDPVPDPARGEVLLDVLAAALSTRARSGASGRHYADDMQPPFIPGFDGVGRTADGAVVYFVSDGAMAERVAVRAADLIPVPPTVDPADFAALANPAMSAWLPLKHRAALAPGETVLVLGATGNGGRAAVQLAKHLGAGTVLAAGRDQAALDALPALGADRLVRLDGAEDEIAARFAELAADPATRPDLVVDYVWGRPTELALDAIARALPDPARPLRWVHVGATAGPAITLPAVFLRKANIQLLGSGQGSVARDALYAAMREVAPAIGEAKLAAGTVAVPLAQVESAWAEPVRSGERLVFVP